LGLKFKGLHLIFRNLRDRDLGIGARTTSALACLWYHRSFHFRVQESQYIISGFRIEELVMGDFFMKILSI
jgi:hypothetical protein